MLPGCRDCSQPLALSLKEKRKQSQSNGVFSNTIHLYSIANLQKHRQMNIGIIKWRSAKLGLLYHADQRRFELKIVGINGLASYN